MGRARSRDSSCSELGDVNWIFCERTVLDLEEDGRSAMVGVFAYRWKGNDLILGTNLKDPQ
jgi:hypothetical protein